LDTAILISPEVNQKSVMRNDTAVLIVSSPEPKDKRDTAIFLVTPEANYVLELPETPFIPCPTSNPSTDRAHKPHTPSVKNI